MSPYCMGVIAKKSSLFVDYYYQVGLVEKTCQLLTDKLFREKLGTAAREHIVDHYPLKCTYLPSYLEWVEQLAQKPVLYPNQFIS